MADVADESLFEALRRQVSEASSQEKLVQCASEVGHALASLHLNGQEARKLSRAAGRARRRREAHDQGYLAALADVLSAVASAMEDQAARSVAQRAVEQSDALTEIVLALYDRPLTPTELTRSVSDRSSDNGSMTRRLKKLAELGIVEPASTRNKKERPRQLTARGHRLANHLQEQCSPIEPEFRLVADALAMLRMVERSGELELRELSACVNAKHAWSDRLARVLAEAAELSGWLDFKMDDERVVWGRELEEWTPIFEKYANRPKAVCELFAGVPPGSLFCTEQVEAWREVLGPVDQIREVSSFRFLQEFSGTFSAVICTDHTVTRSISRMSVAGQYFVVRPRQDELVLTPFEPETMRASA